MNFKKIIFVSILLTILAIGAVSATEDTDVLACEDNCNEQTIESAIDNTVKTDENILEDPSSDDFNVDIKEEININDNSAAVSFNWPDYVKEKNETLIPENYNDQISIDVDGGSKILIYKESGETSKTITLDDLYIFIPGEYNITVSYIYNGSSQSELQLKKATLNVIESTGPQTYTNDTFLELYSTNEYGEAVNSDNKYICTFSDSVSGLNGVITVYANNTIVYTKKLEGTTIIAKTIWSNNLTGTFNGDYNIKVTYQRAADGKLYSKEKPITFINVVGEGSGTDPINNNQNTNTNTSTGTNTQPNTNTVKKDVISLSLKKVTVKKSAKKLTIQATLKINKNAAKGKIIKFNFNKKSYKATTNAKGIAKITIKKSVLKKLKNGKKVTYTATYSKITKKVTVKIKK